MNIGTVKALDGSADSVQAAVAMLERARRSLDIYTPTLNPECYDHPDLGAALRQWVIANPRAHARLLLPPAPTWRNDCSRLAQLIERLSSLELRILAPDEPRERGEFAQGFWIADQRALLHHSDPQRCIGSYNEQGSPRAKEALEFFSGCWNRSLPSLELRRLGV